ncbi:MULTISPECIES: hypothetical protein [Microbacterium]|uniref:NADH:ubiquinone oxidoreductase n=1 Tax=Microbacterium marmarense TaxID=3122051 RepID=A0ABU8LU15_9MICO
MRSYVFGTGLLSALTGGLTLVRGLREGGPFTWRQALAWASWGITVALVVGAIVDTRRAEKGKLAPVDSPVHGKESKLAYQNLNR